MTDYECWGYSELIERIEELEAELEACRAEQ
jgi:hypothetical protein